MELLVTVQANKSIKILVISVISMASSSITFPFICSSVFALRNVSIGCVRVNMLSYAGFFRASLNCFCAFY